jgi:hypothetical protein
VVSNVLGYAPLGFLACVAVHRLHPRWPAVLVATLLAWGLSLTLESWQMFLPMRVPSNVDLALNVLGAWLGALLARGLIGWGLLARWSRWTARWFVPDNRGAVFLLTLWPLALLFPVAVPFGLGQVFERLESAVANGLEDTPWIDWLPMREVDLQPMLPLSEVLCIALGMVLPCLLAFSVLRTLPQRMLASTLGLCTGVLASSLSATLSYGPAHAWDWIGPEVLRGLLLAVLVLAVLLVARPRACLVLALVGVVWQLSMLNQAPADVYFAQTLQNWEQGRFIRFHGLIQWLGWLWPYALLLHLVRRLSMPLAGPA